MGTTILSFQNRVVIETLHSEGRSLQYIANDFWVWRWVVRYNCWAWSAILLQNGREIGSQHLNFSERNDVAKVYPQIYRSQYSGFNTSFDLPTASTNELQLVLRFTDDPVGNGNSSDKWINL